MKVGFVGWRGMVGSVLLERMVAEKDFDRSYESFFFTTSNPGGKAPDVGTDAPPLISATDIGELKKMDIIVTCQGGDYTNDVHPKLRAEGWPGYWIDAASALRMKEDAIIVLDPVNRANIDEGLARGIKDYIGGNCTVSLMLMALGGLFEKGWVEWMTSMTYQQQPCAIEMFVNCTGLTGAGQAASGAGAKNMRELVAQMRDIGAVDAALMDDRASILALDTAVSSTIRSAEFPSANFGAPLAGSLIPWIDKAVEDGQTKEELKGHLETNKILGTAKPIPVDGCCVRIASMRCHSQAITIKLTHDVPLPEIEQAIATHNEWVSVVPNNKEDTLKNLSPAAINGSLRVPVGRIRKMNLGPEFLTCFTVGDQLLWGAAEPVRRMLNICRAHLAAQ